MKNLLLIFCFVIFVACSTSPKSPKDLLNQTNDSVTKVPLQTPNDSIYQEENEYELNYIVCVAEGYKYTHLRKIASEVCDLLKSKFDSLDRYYNAKKRKIVLPDKYDDELWAGQYYPRRQGDNFVSIEMSNAFMDTVFNLNEAEQQKFFSDSLRMFVFANMFTSKTRADSVLNLLLPKFKNAKVFPSQIYLGCMH